MCGRPDDVDEYWRLEAESMEREGVMCGPGGWGEYWSAIADELGLTQEQREDAAFLAQLVADFSTEIQNIIGERCYPAFVPHICLRDEPKHGVVCALCLMLTDLNRPEVVESNEDLLKRVFGELGKIRQEQRLRIRKLSLAWNTMMDAVATWGATCFPNYNPETCEPNQFAEVCFVCQDLHRQRTMVQRRS